MDRLQCTLVISSRYHVENCHFSPNGELLAACFGDFSVRLFRISEQKIDNSNACCGHAHSTIHIDLEWVIREHKDSVWCVRFSPDGRLLCTCSSDKTAKLWNVNSHTLERNFEVHTDTVWSCCFAPPLALTSSEGQVKVVVATGSSDKSVKVWNAESGEVMHNLDGYSDAIDCLDFSSDGEVLCTSSRDGVITVWMNLATARKVLPSASECSQINCSEPIRFALTTVNRSASRFCMFSNIFSCVCLDHEPATATDRDPDVAATSCLNSEDYFSRLDPNELLFAGGPNNSISVWSMGDISAAFRDFLSEGNKSLPDSEISHSLSKGSSSANEHTTSLSEEEAIGMQIETADIIVTSDDNGTADLHITYEDEHQESSGEENGNSGRQQTEPQTVHNAGSFGAQLEVITEEEGQSDLTSVADTDYSESETTLKSTVSLITEGSICISEEPVSLYKVEPRWTLTDHKSTVWDCCTAEVSTPEHTTSSESASSTSVSSENTQLLISCSSDRTLR